MGEKRDPMVGRQVRRLLQYPQARWPWKWRREAHLRSLMEVGLVALNSCPLTLHGWSLKKSLGSGAMRNGL